MGRRDPLKLKPALDGEARMSNLRRERKGRLRRSGCGRGESGAPSFPLRFLTAPFPPIFSPVFKYGINILFGFTVEHEVWMARDD
ncbi:hypothetical protein HPP92_005081 [Vanilla planifolia]|uniref:Uncharacterized protein n=1 Tax=Vanilla planifolia TaxID=51239 RepID=A0A835RYT0_VANPL|nr:hypothetical protein HPP92_005081 [Vanilla planifolia]